MADAKKRFSDPAIKVVVSSSNAWLHLRGVCEFVAHDIPVYALDISRPILEQIIQTPRHSHPDALEHQRRRSRFGVSNKTVIGSGPKGIEPYPMRTERGERMMIVYLPEHRLRPHWDSKINS